MRSREWNTLRARDLNDERGSCFRGETVDRLQFYHAMSKRSDDAPPTRGRTRRHRQRA